MSANAKLMTAFVMSQTFTRPNRQSCEYCGRSSNLNRGEVSCDGCGASLPEGSGVPPLLFNPTAVDVAALSRRLGVAGALIPFRPQPLKRNRWADFLSGIAGVGAAVVRR